MATKFTVTFEDVRKRKEQIKELEIRLIEAKEALRITQEAYYEALDVYIVRWTHKDECGNEKRSVEYVKGTYAEMKDYIRKLRQDGCYYITATGM